jgi:hypothetical protein
LQVIEFAARLGAKIAADGRIQQNSLFFSLLAGKFAVETGSIWAASTTNFRGFSSRPNTSVRV